MTLVEFVRKHPEVRIAHICGDKKGLYYLMLNEKTNKDTRVYFTAEEPAWILTNKIVAAGLELV